MDRKKNKKKEMINVKKKDVFGACATSLWRLYQDLLNIAMKRDIWTVLKKIKKIIYPKQFENNIE